ncbi:SMI1/KNR4 family protein [Lacibacter luteus]|uniref:SMI1/KNR4 family protein n=1 Tax=Lacibacter luteus TaxID=2508719 RepID=A0A4V1M716_9BACT|nr:SMI1/KNR4 family protein [Lacibacter luteus]RXK57789.1 SMI1/KNR4 family protein [Lacibacter luteus]
MTVIEQLKSLLENTYISEDGDEYKIELREGLTDNEIELLAQRLPTGQIPNDVRELLRFTKGFEFYGIDEITFDGVGQFGFENIFPYSVQLGHDGFGNFWILDIDSKGIWGNVFYVCHDPAVVVKQSDNLAQFINHIDEYGRDIENSNLNTIHEKTVFDIWKNNNGFIEITEARNSDDTTLKNFALTLADNFVIADLRDKPTKSGFAWGKFGPNLDKAIKCTDELIWGIEKAEKKGFFSKLFG